MTLAESISKIACAASGEVEIVRQMPVEGNFYSAAECVSLKVTCEGDKDKSFANPTCFQLFLSLGVCSGQRDVEHVFLTGLPLLIRCLDFTKDSAKSFVTLCYEFVSDLPAEHLSFLGPALQSIIKCVSMVNKALTESIEESLYARLKHQLQHCIDTKDVAKEEALLSVIGCVCLSLTNEWIMKVFSLLLHTYLSHPQSFLRSAAFCEARRMIQCQHMSPTQFFVAHQESLCQYVMSYIHSMHWNENSNLDCVHCLRTLDDVATLFDFRSSSELINAKARCLLPPLVYESTIAASAILKVLSQEAGQTKQRMLLDNIRYIFSYIVRKCSPDRLAHAMSFLDTEAGISVDRLLLAEGPNTYNQLLLHISRNPKEVLNGLVFLNEKEGNSQGSIQSEEDLSSLLKPKLLGILAFFNSLLLGTQIENEQKRLGLESLIYLMNLLGSKHLTPVRLKVMAILRLSLTLEQLRDLGLKAWSCFVHNIEMTSLGTLLSEITVCLLPLLDQHADQVADIFTFLFVKCRSALQARFNEIYYMPSHPRLGTVNQVLRECHNAQSTENRLQTRVLQMLKDCQHEQADVRRYAVTSLYSLLQGNRMSILDWINSCDSLNPLLSELIWTILSGCQDSDKVARLAFAACLGEIGAVDPGKLRELSRQTSRKAALVKDGVRSAEFAVLLITELIHAFLAAKDTRGQDCCSFALQETLIAYRCSPLNSQSEQGKLIWSSFPSHHRELLEPHLNSNYKRSKEETEVVTPVPIYQGKQGKSYPMWLCRWLDLLISQIENDTRKMFESCSVVCRHFVQVAAFLLPYLVTEIILQGQPEQMEQISKEMVAVITHAQKNEDTSPAKAEFRHRAAQTVLSLHNSVTQIAIHKQSQYCVAEDQVAKQVPVMTNADLPALKQQCSLLTDFLRGVPKDALAIAAYHCKAYSHSLLLFEDHFVRENPMDVQPHLQILQQLYADMEEADGLDGLATVRSVALTISDQILELEMKGKLRDALACYNVAVQEQPHSLRNHEGLVLAFLGLGENFVALRHLSGVLVEKPQWTKELNKLQVEACWQLGEWDTLQKCLSLEPNPSSEWSVGIGQLLASAKSKKTTEFEKQLSAVREHAVNRLSAVSSDPLSYTRGYEYIVQLHMLQELEDVCRSLILNSGGSDAETTMKNLTQTWSVRLDVTQGSFRIREPILRLRRTLLGLIPNVVVKHHLGDYWLTSAKIARKAGYLQSAFNCILNASSYQAPEHWLEKAKCQWKQGETKQALVVLQDNLRKELSSLKEDSGKPSAHARAMLLVGQWMEETALCDTNTILKQYKDLVKEHSDWESSHFFLAKYYDRLRTALEGTEPGKDFECLPLVIRHFGDSLRHGSHYIYESMPRLLSVWMDFGAEIVKPVSGSSNSKRSGLKAANSQAQLQKMNTIMEELIEHLAAYQFFTCFPQIVSRICHQNESVFGIIKTLVAKLIVSFPQQALWMMVAVSKSSYDTRKYRCQEIFRAAVALDSSLNKPMADLMRLAAKLIEVCDKEAKTTRLDMNSDFRQLVNLVTEQHFSSVIIPDQGTMTVSLPASSGAHPTHYPFPSTVPYIVGFDPEIEVIKSMAKPKKIVIRGSDGKGYTMICKPKDDLRKDCRLMEFNSLVNRCLYRDVESRRRGLRIRTYTVVPLNDQCGLLQWVNDTVALRTALMKLYTEKKKNISGKDLRTAWRLIEKNPRSKEVRQQVMGSLIDQHKPPVLHEWFLRTFPDPASWYESQVSYSRTVAVMSMVGYVLGLGDRHTENILLDSTCGDVVHVDFDCLFNKGETFEHPERVPFRLTQNMVDAMGFTGCEGLFRKACEVTLRVLRDQRDPLLSVLKTLIHDPLVEWEKGKSDPWSAQKHQKKSKSEQTEVVNETGVKKVNDVEQRLRGLMAHNKGLPLSIEGQVHYLIQEARDYNNLCFMYMGWAPFL
ncbi:serine/threonine-protein kinase ATR-like [Corticium candelabrum]|uniref:serine/threonine-protein kinase ATR-like n=1 Tax=Corticium candelabrum TaxID=121492 RepID=UPI002E268097|nr:serine/threonine-protein kinase ATR-like [Corticium candelabrum]